MVFLFLRNIIFHFLYNAHFLLFFAYVKKSFKNERTGLSDFEGLQDPNFCHRVYYQSGIITQKHDNSQKWRSCHLGSEFTTCLMAQFSKRKHSAELSSTSGTNQSAGRPSGESVHLSDRTGNLELGLHLLVHCHLSTPGLFFF